MRKSVLVLGATGMAGHLISLFLHEKGYNVIAFSRKPFIHCNNMQGDAMDKDVFVQYIKNGDYDVIINAIGLLKEACDEHISEAIYLNSYLPHLLCDITENMKTKIIHISTDCVFLGTTGPYLEDSCRDADSLYGKTKALGEIWDNKNLTFRCSIIGPDINENGKGLFNWFMKQKDLIEGYGSVYWTGITTITLANAIYCAIEENLTGLYNLVNNLKISKYELLCKINETFDKKVKINRSDEMVLVRELINTRKDFSFIVPSYEEMIMDMKCWIFEHSQLYGHYFA